MGDSGLIAKDKSEVESISLTQLFERECPYYMSYGMSFDQYWYESPYLAYFYREAYKLRLRHEDTFMWNQGMYIYEALCDVSPVLHAFSKSGTKPLPYRTKPMLEEINDLQTEKEKAKIRETKIKNEQLKARVFFENWARRTAEHFNNN